MFEKLIDQLRSDGPNLPNSLSTAVGDLIRKARISANMSQADLAIKTYLKQSSISRIELGTRAVTMEDLIYLCICLKKPISYFFPKHWLLEDEVEKNLMPLEKELLMQVMQLDNDDLRRLIAQARALVELSEK